MALRKNEWVSGGIGLNVFFWGGTIILPCEVIAKVLKLVFAPMG